MNAVTNQQNAEAAFRLPVERLGPYRLLAPIGGGACGTVYRAENTQLGGTETTSADYLRTLAVARVLLDNFDNVQASWVTQGPKLGSAAMAFGVNDMGSTMIEENVVSAAGTAYHMNEREIVRAIEDAGFVPMRRDMTYENRFRPGVLSR